MSQLWLLITALVIGLFTYGTRLSFIVFIGSAHVPTRVQQALRFVPVAALTALVTPALFFPGGTLNLSLTNGHLIAGLLAILVAWRTKNVLLTLICGMLCLWLFQIFVPAH